MSPDAPSTLLRLLGEQKHPQEAQCGDSFTIYAHAQLTVDAYLPAVDKGNASKSQSVLAIFLARARPFSVKVIFFDDIPLLQSL